MICVQVGIKLKSETMLTLQGSEVNLLAVHGQTSSDLVGFVFFFGIVYSFVIFTCALYPRVRSSLRKNVKISMR